MFYTIENGSHFMKILKVVVLICECDILYLYTDLPSAVPKISTENAFFKLECARGTGITYTNTHFSDCEIKIIDLKQVT